MNVLTSVFTPYCNSVVILKGKKKIKRGRIGHANYVLILREGDSSHLEDV